ncbi:MAG TPA: S41 family peptidase [Pyrinomonadaceae bacterium]|nr:S41 family peptidase [Pyrinomonadaceae bacterium]
MRVKVLASSLIVLFQVVVSASAQSSLSELDRRRGLTMLNEIKLDLKRNYYDPTFRGMDLDARFKQGEERIKNAPTHNQIFGIIAEILVDLNDSHTFFVPPGRTYTFEYGWEMQMIGDKCYVIAVKPGSDAEAKGLKEGDEIYTIDNIGPIRENLWKIHYLYNALTPRTRIHLNVIKPDGKRQEFDVESTIVEGKRVIDTNEFFDLVSKRQKEDRRDFHRFYETDDLVIWKMLAFDLEPHEVDKMAGRVKNRKALILDLRGNGGGDEITLLRMVANFFDRDVKLGDIKRRKETRSLEAKTRAANAFTGKLIVLIDSESGSAAELFARVVQLEKRGIVIGDVSSGAVMRSRYYPHQLGVGTVVFYGVSITDADIIMTDGKSLEHVGVTPDELKLPTPKELAAKHDSVLAYAMSLAGVTMTPEKAGTLFPVIWSK